MASENEARARELCDRNRITLGVVVHHPKCPRCPEIAAALDAAERRGAEARDAEWSIGLASVYEGTGLLERRALLTLLERMGMKP
jgi:hypothetical protein